MPQRSGWFVLSTQPNREAFALDNLIRQGFTVYCPMLVKHIRHARRAYDAPRPLFPGYMFVEHWPGQCWHPVLGTYGVRSIIRNGEMPSLLPSGFVTSLKAREVNGMIRKPEKPFAAGQQVTVNGGPFDGLTGRIVEVRESDRILLLLDLLNRQAKVHVEAGMLRLA
ncbi:MAG: transcriptional activator RfaH [Rhodomicrobium sp.]|nr:transcriptional activator RfaH [Rhodomicrobium sp.]